MSKFISELAVRLRAARKKVGLSCAELNTLLGIDRERVCVDKLISFETTRGYDKRLGLEFLSRVHTFVEDVEQGRIMFLLPIYTADDLARAVSDA